MRQICRGRVYNVPERVAAIVYREGEVRHVSEGGDGNFGRYPEGGTASVAREEYTIKYGYLTFEPGGMSTINWWPIVGQVS